jgi:hypothetical protein
MLEFRVGLFSHCFKRVGTLILDVKPPVGNLKVRKADPVPAVVLRSTQLRYKPGHLHLFWSVRCDEFNV